MRRFTGVAVVVAATAALLSSFAAGPPAHASPTVSGNHAAIAFYRHVVAATQRQRAVEEVQTGFVALQDRVLKGTATVAWTTGTGRVPTGFVPVTEHLTVASKGGKIAWATDLFTPDCPTKLCPDVPYQVLLTASGMLGRVTGNVKAEERAGRCWAQDKGGNLDALSVGAPFGYQLVGHYRPLERSGSTVKVTSTYPWGMKGSATEVDTINARTDLPTSGVTKVAATAGNPAFTYRWTSRWLAHAPAEPKVTCKAKV